MKKIKNKYIILLSLIIIIILGIIGCNLYSNSVEEKEISNLIKEINSHYNEYVITTKDTLLYNEDKEEVGKIGSNITLTLEDQDIISSTEYFKVKDFDNYYIKYQDVKPILELSKINDRYKNYIVFNENIVTSDKTIFYDENDELVYEIYSSFDLPIIIKDDEKYGVEFNDRLLYVKKSNVKEVKISNNTTTSNASGVGVLNYHAFYDDANATDRAECNTSICHSKTQFKEHLDYFKENNILTLKISELEMYIDGKIQLPKSVLLTIDDGGRTTIAMDLLTEYKMYATIFLVTSWYEPSEYNTTEYIELHSHSHNLHNTGDCPTGQGGGIQCLKEEVIQEDLRISREKLNNTTYFCYPFYEYNNYSEKMLKEAGFTMAFIGESSSSDNLVHVGSNKFRLRRFVIVTYTTIDDLDNYFDQII